MGYRSKQRIPNRGISNGLEVLNIPLSSQGNVNQKDPEISSYTCQNG